MHTLLPVPANDPAAVLIEGKYYKMTDSFASFTMNFGLAAPNIILNTYGSAYGIHGYHMAPESLKKIGGLFQLAWGNQQPYANFLYP
jgi:hypothetical protein